MQLKQFYNIATKVSSRKSGTTFGDLPDCLYMFGFAGKSDFNFLCSLDFTEIYTIQYEYKNIVLELQSCGGGSVRLQSHYKLWSGYFPGPYHTSITD